MAKIQIHSEPLHGPLANCLDVGERIKNIFDDLPDHLPKEMVQILGQADDLRIERIISHGHASPADFSDSLGRSS